MSERTGLGGKWVNERSRAEDATLESKVVRRTSTLLYRRLANWPGYTGRVACTYDPRFTVSTMHARYTEILFRLSDVNGVGYKSSRIIDYADLFL